MKIFEFLHNNKDLRLSAKIKIKIGNLPILQISLPPGFPSTGQKISELNFNATPQMRPQTAILAETVQMQGRKGDGEGSLLS